MSTPGKRLAEARSKMYRSARAAALNINVPVSTYNSHERAGEPGARRFSPEEAERYGRAFGVSPVWLLFGTEESAPPAAATEASSAPIARPSDPPNASTPISLPPADETKLPVYGRAIGGDEGRFSFNGEVIGTVFTPPVLQGVVGAYAVEVSGDSMFPRIRPGETVWVDPRRPSHKGDDVIVQMHPTEEGGEVEGYVKELVGWTPKSLVLLQHNPQKEIVIDRAAVISVHKVVFQARL